MIHFIRGQQLRLFAERALYWVEGKTAVITDPHFGKAATFRAAGIPLPAGTTADNLARLTAVLEQTNAERLLILGDLIHAKAGQTANVHEQVAAWRQRFSTLAIDLVLGNHDQHAGVPPAAWGMTVHQRLVERPFVWQHHPEPDEAGYVLSGHIHPAVRLKGSGEQVMIPCFYFGKQFGILPAFGAFTGYGTVKPKRGETVFLLADDQLIRKDV